MAQHHRLEIEALDHTVKPVLGHRDLFAHPPAEGNQGAEFTDMDGGHPNFGDDVGDQQSDQSFDIFLVSFYSGFSDLADFTSMSYDSFRNQGSNNIIDIPDVTGCF